MQKYRFALNLQLFAEEGAETGVEGAGEAALQTDEASETVVTGDETKPEAGDDKNPPDPNTAWEKRIAAIKQKATQEAREQIEKEYGERYKDHDTYKKAAEFLQRTAGIDDLMTLQEEIELAELTERAEKEKVPPSVLKRIDELEVKAARVDEIDAAAKQQEEWAAFETTLKDFCGDKTIDGKPVDHMELWKFMHENGVSKPEVAYKAMKADILEGKLETAKTDAVNEYLASKTAPKTGGTQGAPAAQTQSAAPGMKGAEQRALARIQAAREAQ